MILSIVIPTLGRVSEVRELLKSIELSKIENLSFEIVIVDQNFSNLLDSIVREFTQKGFLIKHFKVDFRGLSKAKNFGLKCAVGKYICFPDDDALFASNTIVNAVGLLENNMYRVVCGKCMDVNGVDSVKKFSVIPGLLNLSSFEDKFIEATMFFRKKCLEDFLYDESLGIGTFHGAEEGFDIVYRMLLAGVEIYYDPCILFYHPQVITSHCTNQEIRRVFNYRCGFAKVCLKHSLYLKYFKRLFLVIFYIPYLLIFKRSNLRYYLAELLGLLAGVVIK